MLEVSAEQREEIKETVTSAVFISVFTFTGTMLFWVIYYLAASRPYIVFSVIIAAVALLMSKIN